MLNREVLENIWIMHIPLKPVTEQQNSQNILLETSFMAQIMLESSSKIFSILKNWFTNVIVYFFSQLLS